MKKTTVSIANGITQFILIFTLVYECFSAEAN